MLTTQQLRCLIDVYEVTEDDQTVVIKYWKGKTDCGIVVDKKENVDLMEFTDGPVSQWDAINIVVYVEEKKQKRGALQTINLKSNQELYDYSAQLGKTIYGKN